MTTWPKVPPTLSVEQESARNQFMRLWHEELPKKYGMLERFNHGYVSKLGHKFGSKTLEIGAGLGEHSKYEDLTDQDYYCLEYRKEFCLQLEKLFPKERIACGNIHEKQPWADGSFDRVIAIHVLEHLINLPLALAEISRLLKDDGYFDVVIPTEGKFLYSFARKISSERFFLKKFKMDYTPIIRNEHVSDYDEIVEELHRNFSVSTSRLFPSFLPIPGFNLCAGFRFKKKLNG